MITDKETNFVYLSGLMEKLSPVCFKQLTGWFDRLGIGYEFIRSAKDLWVVDFMPLQVSVNHLVQFVYNPDYLKPLLHKPTKTEPKTVWEELNIDATLTNIVIDGGNVVKSADKAILTDKIFKENLNVGEVELVAAVKQYLQLSHVIIIPREPGDFIGHADGMVRFIDEQTVLVNKYPAIKKYTDFERNLQWSLRNAGINLEFFPYTAWQNQNSNDAKGCYINFLEIGDYIFCPQFNTADDRIAMEILQRTFVDREIIGIDCSDLAMRGGVLNCATWNILKT